ncbi:MAG TPA: hypothetical protein VIV66_16920 [Pyrinomonadaceae bacterium]
MFESIPATESVPRAVAIGLQSAATVEIAGTITPPLPVPTSLL